MLLFRQTYRLRHELLNIVGSCCSVQIFTKFTGVGCGILLQNPVGPLLGLSNIWSLCRSPIWKVCFVTGSWPRKRMTAYTILTSQYYTLPLAMTDLSEISMRFEWDFSRFAFLQVWCTLQDLRNLHRLVSQDCVSRAVTPCSATLPYVSFICGILMLSTVFPTCLPLDPLCLWSLHFILQPYVNGFSELCKLQYIAGMRTTNPC